jgi:hypothetical protein
LTEGDLARMAPGLLRSSFTACVIALLLAAAGRARALDAVGREERLVDIHAALLDLSPVEAPGALAAGQLDLGLELVTIPFIDGDTGAKREITASDHARVFPRPRLALGLPAPSGFRAFVGAAYIPPVELRQIRVDLWAGEAGIAWAPGPLRVGLRGHLVHVEARSPVSDPALRDRLRAEEQGLDLSAGYALRLGRLDLTPYAGLGRVWLRGDFRSSFDGGTVHSVYAGPALSLGARVVHGDRWEAVAEWTGYPGRLVDARFRIGYLFDLGR